MKKHHAPRSRQAVKRFFDFSAWFDARGLKDNTTYLIENIKRMFIISPPGEKRRVEEVAKEAGLSKSEVVKRARGLWWMSVMMVLVACCVFAYTIYHVIHLNYLAISVSAVLTLLSLGFAFRYHFWYYQIKRGEFGCTFNEWFKHGFLGAKK